MKYSLSIFLLCMSTCLISTEEAFMTLKQQHCVPCEGGVAPLKIEKIKEYLSDYPEWSLAPDEPKRIQRTYTFKNFVKAMGFVNAIAYIAEAEGHHPNILIEYNKVTLILYTHAIGGLSTNDFIIAGLADEAWEKMPEKSPIDAFTSLQVLKDEAFLFVDERDWHQFHNLRNLSMSISAEAAELMELFLWKNDKELEEPLSDTDKHAIEEELSDVLLGILTFANRANIDITRSFLQKLVKIKEKYAVNKIRGINKKIQS